jgi:hypothetical protein
MRDEARSVERAKQDGGAAGEIQVVEESARTPGQRPAFVWRPVGSGAEYRVTVYDAQGRMRWSRSTRDTVVALPPDAPIRAGESLFWSVDALRADGAAVTSGIRELRVAP